jgi:hypothetical protein
MSRNTERRDEQSVRMLKAEPVTVAIHLTLQGKGWRRKELGC